MPGLRTASPKKSRGAAARDAAGARARLAGLLLLAACAPGAEAPERDGATIYRDQWGVPHIYAASERAGLYANGWAMAEDRAEETLKNFLRGMGEYAAAFGRGENDADLRADLEARMWDHYGTARRNYERLPQGLRDHLAAFADGINGFLDAHPERRPEWWGDRRVDVYMPVAFSRQFIWSWPAGQAADDLRSVGLEPSYDVDFRSSNEMAVAPERSAVGAAMLVIDPHLGWFGRQRYWEMRLHAGDIHISGFATAGFPYVNLGHNRDVAWAHTTGGPDTADVYELSLDPDDPVRYRYDDAWRDLESRSVSVTVAGEESPVERTFWYSHLGPIVARRGDKAYAAALAYADEIGYLESKYLFMKAKDYRDVIAALEVRQIMPQNVMVADTGGNIYYQRTGRVPVRAPGYDYSAPLDGSTSATAWRGLHPTADLIQILNPPQGYMQNCNITPDVMMPGSPMTADRYPGYLFNQPARLTHQRATRATELLRDDPQITPEELIEIALDRKALQYERWVAELERAAAGAELPPAGREMLAAIVSWDGFQHRHSAGALAYYRWRHELAEALEDGELDRMRVAVDDYLQPFAAGATTTEEPWTPVLEASDGSLLVDALRRAAEHADAATVFGDVFRVGRLDWDGDTVSWPVGGGSLRREGMATVRAIGFAPEGGDGMRWGRSGQTSTQVVVLYPPQSGRGVESWTQPPIGQSDVPSSAHFRDQAQRLLAPARMKPSWFERAQLLDGHVRSQEKLAVPEP